MKKISKILFLLFFTLSIKAQDKSVFDIARKGTISEIETIYNLNPELINAVDDESYSPLILSCYRGNVEVAFFLIERVSDINYISGDGTALMAAVMAGNTKIIEKLISQNANLNLSDSQGKTALIFAVFFNKNDIVKILLKGGVDIKLKDVEGKSALDYAVLNKNTELIILLDQ